ncbi:hypothetical protein C0991_007548 [Blastosporella zonata]|nr:hypothetical protein C0991_007548 [Blastosporella zonata]
MANHQLHPLEVNSLTGEPFLRLRNHKNIILTPPRAEDVALCIPIMNDPCIYEWLSSPPFPYTAEHAEAWYKKIKTQSDDTLAALEAARETAEPILVGASPVRVIREVKDDGTDVYLGDIGVARVHDGKLLAPPSEAVDEEKIAKYLEANIALSVGDENIVWTIGGWFVAFVGQAVATASFGNGGVGVLWFAIFLQAFLILGVIYTLASDSISMNRFQISVFGSIAIVFAVTGVNQGIFTHSPSLSAMAAGWLILAIVDILWVLYFTSEEDSLALHVFNSLGTGGLTPPSRRRRTRTQNSMHMATNNGYVSNYGAGGVIASHEPYDPKIGGGSGGIGSGAYGSTGSPLRSQNSFGGGSLNDQSRSMGGVTGGAGSIHNSPGAGGAPSIGGGETQGPNSPLMAGVGAGGSRGPSPLPEPAPVEASFSHKAKALYSYTASPDDSNEISFSKGEILDIMDKNGKWWQTRKGDGKIGIAPSNYLQII